MAWFYVWDYHMVIAHSKAVFNIMSLQCSGHEPGIENMNGMNEGVKWQIEKEKEIETECKRHIRLLLEASTWAGAEPGIRTSVPFLSLSKSPRLKADVSRSPALPSPSLETALNRWASQQVQESAQVPSPIPPSVSALVFKFPHIFSSSLNCPCNVVLDPPPVPQAPPGPPLLYRAAYLPSCMQWRLNWKAQWTNHKYQCLRFVHHSRREAGGSVLWTRTRLVVAFRTKTRVFLLCCVSLILSLIPNWFSKVWWVNVIITSGILVSHFLQTACLHLERIHLIMP